MCACVCIVSKKIITNLYQYVYLFPHSIRSMRFRQSEPHAGMPMALSCGLVLQSQIIRFDSFFMCFDLSLLEKLKSSRQDLCSFRLDLKEQRLECFIRSLVFTYYSPFCDVNVLVNAFELSRIAELNLLRICGWHFGGSNLNVCVC